MEDAEIGETGLKLSINGGKFDTRSSPGLQV